MAEQRQPDGTRIHLRNGGDEWFNWHDSADGYTVAQDQTGFWRYVRVPAGSLDLEPVPDGIVGRANPNALGLKPHARPAPQLIRQRVEQIRGGARLARRPMPPSASVSSEISVAPSPPSSGDAGPGKAGGVGFDRRTLKCVVIVAAFQDHWDTANNTVLLAKGRPPAEYEPLFNRLGYNLDGAAGSVRDYYLENSYGKVTIEFIPTGCVCRTTRPVTGATPMKPMDNSAAVRWSSTPLTPPITPASTLRLAMATAMVTWICCTSFTPGIRSSGAEILPPRNPGRRAGHRHQL